VAKDAMAIRYHQKTSPSITRFLEAPFAGKHSELIKKGTKATVAEAAEVAAKTEVVGQQEKTVRLPSEFEALGGGAYTAAQSMVIEATAAEAAAASKAATAAHEDRTPLKELNLVNYSSGGAETMGKVDFTALPGPPASLDGAGGLPRLAVGCGEATEMTFDPNTCEYAVGASSMHSRLQAQIPYYSVVAISRDSNEEFKARGGSLSSEEAKAAIQAEQRAEEIEKRVKHLQLRTECAEKTAEVATAETPALFSGCFCYLRLAFKGRELARKLPETAKKKN
jgi:hypothetical protein